MFNDTDDGQTRYCPMCEEWAEKYEKLKAENEKLKEYKMSKQASYEAMQSEWNRAINENRELKKWLEEERQINDKLNQLYQDEHCEVLELADRMSFLNADRTAEIMELKQTLEKIEEVVSLDDVNCTISAETPTDNGQTEKRAVL